MLAALLAEPVRALRHRCEAPVAPRPLLNACLPVRVRGVSALGRSHQPTTNRFFSNRDSVSRTVYIGGSQYGAGSSRTTLTYRLPFIVRYKRPLILYFKGLDPVIASTLLSTSQSTVSSRGYTGTIHKPRCSADFTTVLSVTVPFHLCTLLNAVYEP